MSQLSLIDRRRQEITDELTRLDQRRSEMEQELRDLDVAERVLARLTGAERPEASARDERQPEKASGGKPENIPPVPVMIEEALGSGPAVGMVPKEVRRWIAERYWPQAKGEVVSSILWRMWKRKQLVKNGTRYRLPRKDEAADTDAGEQSPAASLSQPDAQGEEPGGGT